MQATILDIRTDKSGTCYLCRISLADYIDSLPVNYQSYDVQRAIVANAFLDRLVDTVLSSGHIPPIVLVVESKQFNKQDGRLLIESFKILDGLQRTYRLQAIRKTMTYAQDASLGKDQLEWSRFKFSKAHSKGMVEINSNTDVLRRVFQAGQKEGIEKLIRGLNDNYQWFEVWTGLTAQAEISKMLTLNAGHKPVTTRHQLELLFLNLLPLLRTQLRGKFIVREKEVSATSFSKSRKPGQFHFAHIISALLSFRAESPVTPSADLIRNLQEDDGSSDRLEELADVEFMTAFVTLLTNLDELISTTFSNREVGALWMGREITLAGISGALGSYSVSEKVPGITAITRLREIITRNPAILNLEGFEEARNSVDLSKVNIGKVNRMAVYRAIGHLLHQEQPTTIDWRKYFTPDPHDKG